MNILILGGHGYLGRATWEYLEARGHEVTCIDSHIKDSWLAECKTAPLFQPPGRDDYRWTNARRLRPQDVLEFDAVIHYAEQASAPYSMRGTAEATETILNNVMSTHALIEAVHKGNPDCHILKLGTLGEYGTPGLDIPDGWLRLSDTAHPLLFPKRPGSLYHTTKVMDSSLLEWAVRTWGLRATDLHQGVVYGCRTDQLPQTTFYYDAIFGTALNRFIAQAVAGVPLTVYGKGGQTRGWLNILDTLQCVELALESPPPPGNFRVLNQFTETFEVLELAQRVARITGAKIAHVKNPRVEEEEHYYSVSNEGFQNLGLRAHTLSDDVLAEMVDIVRPYKDEIDRACIMPEVTW